ncbi:hypothetical protein ANCCAN_01331 [Ancylostoma caninum]|uniref:DDE Tnp4 domain-containing protein n=1 Tax=Ancylostoma caninum TaxID=29170 RepID=A0A368H7R3_ANCCA|nr:hypothetical protein ANCCAN_01331 [Ancylostoma caninum]
MPFVCTRFRIFDQYLASNDPERFCEYTRLIPWEFEDLYESIAPELHYMGTHAAPISGRHRHVGFGSSSVALAQEVCCGRKTVSDIVEEVALAIIKVLSSDAFPTPTREMFEECASKTRARYDYPRAEGFLDGKHVRIKKPEHSGSTYWNYQNFFSIILLAVCDVDYRIIAYDVGAPGRAGDAGVFRDSSIKRFLDENDDLFPETRTLGNVGPVQFHVLVSGGFGQAHRYVRPYTQAEADNGSKRRFNTKHSR